MFFQRAHGRKPPYFVPSLLSPCSASEHVNKAPNVILRCFMVVLDIRDVLFECIYLYPSCSVPLSETPNSEMCEIAEKLHASLMSPGGMDDVAGEWH